MQKLKDIVILIFLTPIAIAIVILSSILDPKDSWKQMMEEIYE